MGLEGDSGAAGGARHSLSDEASLSTIRKMIRVEMSEVGVEDSESFDCLVAVTEACSNAVLHGRGQSTPRVSWEIDRSAARFLIEDYSIQQWSRTDHPSRSLELPLEEEARIGGFGIELMRGLMDEVDIRIGPEGTSVALVKLLD